MKLVQRFAKANAGALLRATDLSGASAGAVSKALSRLEASGHIKRVAKGVYYVPKQTLLGESRPSAPNVVAKALPGRVRPRGVTAANLLGLSTQVAAKAELIVYGQSQLNEETFQAKRRKGNPKSGIHLPPVDAAILEVLRDRGRFSELSDQETLLRVREALAGRHERETSEKGELMQVPLAQTRLAFSTQDGSQSSKESKRLRKLVESAMAEPPRVRAMLGALLEELNAPKRLWKPLRESLNPLSRFDFGAFRGLQNAKEWQAK
jgi:hypothetical protein